MLAFALLLVTLAAAALVLLVGLVWWQQERIVFQPPGGWDAGGVPPRAREARYRAADGQELLAYVVQAPIGATDRSAERYAGRTYGESRRRVLIAFHGNADLAVWGVPWALEVVRRTGWTVLLAEYRSYGGLPGAATYEGSRLDARAAYAHVRDAMGAGPAGVALFGHSLGSAVAADLAAEVRPVVLLLQSPFTSARAMARLVITPPMVGMFWRVISRVHFDTEARVRTLDVPVHVAHGDGDFVVPVRMGRAVYAAARVPGRLLIARGRGHNDVEGAGEEYWAWVVGALGSAEHEEHRAAR